MSSRIIICNYLLKKVQNGGHLILTFQSNYVKKKKESFLIVDSSFVTLKVNKTEAKRVYSTIPTNYNLQLHIVATEIRDCLCQVDHRLHILVNSHNQALMLPITAYRSKHYDC